MSATNDLTKFILNRLFKDGIYAWRNSVGAIKTSHGFYQMGKVGSSDIMAVLPPDGRFLGIEVKTGKDRIRPEQEGFMGNVRRMGGICLVVHDEEDFTSKFNEIHGNNHV